MIDIVVNEIAREINKNSNKTIKGALNLTGLELGTITSTGLKIDTFGPEIKSYLILDYLKLNDSYSTETASLHSHSYKTPDKLKSIKVGDRVLVALVRNEFIVVGRVADA